MLGNDQRNSHVKLPIRSMWYVFLWATLCLLGSCRLAAPALEPIAVPMPDIALDCHGIDRELVFAGFGWYSAQIHNHIAARILQKGFGCEFTDLPGSTSPLTQALVRGDIDISMEIWLHDAPQIYRDAATTGDVVDLGLNMTAVEYSFLVPRYVIEGDVERGIEPLAPNLSSVADLPGYASVFQDPEHPNKGRYYNCIISWRCAMINTDKLSTYGLNDYFIDFSADNSEALTSSLAAAYEKGEPWLGFYWGPTWVLGSFDMVAIKEPEYSDDCWVDGDHGCAYPTYPVNVVISKGFSELASEAMLDFLRAYEVDQLLMSELLAYRKENDAEAAAVARHFLANRPEVWTMWVPDEVANRVRASLN